MVGKLQSVGSDYSRPNCTCALGANVDRDELVDSNVSSIVII